MEMEMEIKKTVGAVEFNVDMLVMVMMVWISKLCGDGDGTGHSDGDDQ